MWTCYASLTLYPNLRKIGNVTATREHNPVPNNNIIKIVIRKIKNWPSPRCKPIRKYIKRQKMVHGIIRIGNILHRSLATKNVEVR